MMALPPSFSPFAAASSALVTAMYASQCGRHAALEHLGAQLEQRCGVAPHSLQVV
jgi:hypothetical protein